MELALLGYAGLGATARGTEPAAWMAATLRGRPLLPLEDSLTLIAEAIQRRFPPHMRGMKAPAAPVHFVIAPAFLGTDPRFYFINLTLAADGVSHRVTRTRYTRAQHPTGSRISRFAIAGSGAPYLLKNQRWIRWLLRLVRAVNESRIPPLTAADHLAALCYEVHYEVHRSTSDQSVGHRSIVAWRLLPGHVPRANSGHQFYTALNRDDESPPLPTIANGMDLGAIVTALTQHFLAAFEAARLNPADDSLDMKAMGADLANLPDFPDDTLP